MANALLKASPQDPAVTGITENRDHRTAKKYLFCDIL